MLISLQVANMLYRDVSSSNNRLDYCIIRADPTPLSLDDEHLKVPGNLLDDLGLEYTDGADGLIIKGESKPPRWARTAVGEKAFCPVFRRLSQVIARVLRWRHGRYALWFLYQCPLSCTSCLTVSTNGTVIEDVLRLRQLREIID